jgi:DNA adenine methylase
MTNYSPLRYPGGKGKIAPYVAALLQMNGLEGCHYAEPFAGGAAVALDLLFSERVKHIHINDLDWTIYAFWKAVLDHTVEFIEKIQSTPVSIETWLAARDISHNPQKYNILDVGFSTFFLNRTNRSGILNGGVIGGISQKGRWKIDCRFNKDDLTQRIKRIGMYKTRITVTNLDASDFILKYTPKIKPRSLIYIDPPYYVKGAFLYQNHFVHSDHVCLANSVRSIKRHAWFVSYDNVKQIRRIYNDFEQETFNIGYSARNYNKGEEVIIFKPGLKRPQRIFANKTELRELLRSASR